MPETTIKYTEDELRALIRRDLGSLGYDVNVKDIHFQYSQPDRNEGPFVSATATFIGSPAKNKPSNPDR